jgi:nicotinate-nucleotide adenylyltransferase
MAGLIGVFGGTFDPPHLGHLALAEAGFEDFNLDRVLWVLTQSPPHKPDDPITLLEARWRMVEETLRPFPHFELSRVDIDRPAPHYAIGTMSALRALYPEGSFVYLMGEDSLRDLPTWHKPAQFVESCDMLGVMRRSSIEIDLMELEKVLPGIGAKVRFSLQRQVDISARDIRRRVREGLPFEHLVPHAVAHLIHELGLYR